MAEAYSAEMMALVLLLGFALQSPATGDTTEFSRLRQQWARELHEKMVDAIVAEYADDGDFLIPTGERAHGREALRKLFQSITATLDSDLIFHAERVEVSGGLAYDSGTYDEKLVVRASGKRQTSKGSYLTVYRRNSKGTWLIVEQCWTGTVVDEGAK